MKKTECAWKPILKERREERTLASVRTASEVRQVIGTDSEPAAEGTPKGIRATKGRESDERCVRGKPDEFNRRVNRRVRAERRVVVEVDVRRRWREDDVAGEQRGRLRTACERGVVALAWLAERRARDLAPVPARGDDLVGALDGVLALAAEHDVEPDGERVQRVGRRVCAAGDGHRPAQVLGRERAEERPQVLARLVGVDGHERVKVEDLRLPVAERTQSRRRSAIRCDGTSRREK